MAYIDPTDLAERPGARELAQVATAEHRPIVDTELMDATLRGGDRSKWSAADQADADVAMARVLDAVAEADALIDGFLAKRGYTLPLAPVPRLVTGWSRSIARYLLHKSRISMESNDPIVRDYRDALKLLQLTADGKFSLGADDVVATGGSSTDVRFSYPEPVFGRKQLNSFR
ncbi:gp436 family protein [Comamonas resistens]|uniref:gp436 family protein n=1 Tax=Comamonas resistens TaxID=3046670 RepID=UPI0039BCF8E2